MRFSPPSMRIPLLLLVLLALVPVFAVTLYSHVDRRDESSTHVTEHALIAAQSVASRHDQAIARARRLLAPVATLLAPSWHDGGWRLDKSACTDLLASLSMDEIHATAGIAARDGTVLCTAMPAGSAVNVADRAYFQSAVSTRDFAVGTYELESITGTVGLSVGYPITGPYGSVIGVAFASIDLPAMADAAIAAFLPAGSVATVTNRDGTVLWRSVDAADWVGKSVSGLPAFAATRREGTIEATGLDGQRRLIASAMLHLTDGREVVVHVGVPTSVAFAGADRALKLNLATLFGVSLFALGVAWKAGHVTVGETRSQVPTTNRVADEDLDTHADPPHLHNGTGDLAAATGDLATPMRFDERRAERLNAVQEARLSAFADQVQALETRDAELVDALAEAERVADEARSSWLSSFELQCTSNSEGYFVRLSPGFARTFGFTEEELLRRPYMEFLHPDDRGAAFPAWNIITTTGAPLIAFENRFRHRDGSYRWLEWNAVPMAGGLIRAIARDITPARQAEAELRARSRQLAQANEELESFAYSVSHDLRAPLRAIVGFTEQLLGYGEALDERGRDRLMRVHAGAQRMNELIDGILRLSRTSSADLTIGTIDLTAVAQAMVTELRAGDPGRSVEVVIAPGLQAEGDSQLLEALLQNVLGNAWKFTSHRESAHIEFGTMEDDGAQVFYVRDDGAGFNPEYADKLFEPFQRLHSPTEFEGSGIGLATAQRIVRRHGGEIWGEGVVDGGATFYFTLGGTASAAGGRAA